MIALTSLHGEGRPGKKAAHSKSLAGDTSTVPVQVSESHQVPLGYIIGIDGKRYPPRPMTPGDRLGLIAHVHDLACGQSLSIRQVIGALETQHGVRRSVGSISSYLHEWTCFRCSGDQPNPPEQQLGGGA